MPRVPYDELLATLERAFAALGLAPQRAALAARLMADTDCDGVATHGTARFGRFAEMVALGRINPRAEPQCEAFFGAPGSAAFERWTGHRGPGSLAAHACMARALELARIHGIGGVALRDTTHWLRGGAFGWQAADAGQAALCWTNTLPNLPPWGATSAALGNNPLVIAVPDTHSGNHIVLDMAMSQYSYGTLASYRERGEPLPFPGGFDAAGNLTTDAAAIEQTQRALPIGLWKGAGLSFTLDLLAAMLSGGLATHQIPADPLAEVGQSQVFLAFAPGMASGAEDMLRGAIGALHSATPAVPGKPPRFPGERTLAVRAHNREHGVPVDDAHWQRIETQSRS
jgi:3-dehydro-L-gulonate 2-dehydrogenase